MKKVSIEKATASLAKYAGELNGSPLVITEKGKPIAALVPVAGVDLESLAVGTNPKFLDIIERSRRREKNEGGLSITEIREHLGLSIPKKKTTTRKAKRRVS